MANPKRKTTMHAPEGYTKDDDGLWPVWTQEEPIHGIIDHIKTVRIAGEDRELAAIVLESATSTSALTGESIAGQTVGVWLGAKLRGLHRHIGKSVWIMPLGMTELSNGRSMRDYDIFVR